MDNKPLCRERNKLDLAKMRGSAGLGAVWMSPMGIMSFSLSRAFNDDPTDMTESFQFNIGTSF